MYFFGKKKSLGWDRLAGASAEIGTAFVAVTLVIGAMWGRLTWGVFWQWDARLTTTALLFVTYIGYLAVRRLGGTHEQRGRRSAVIGMLAVLEIPLVHWSVRLWRSLHQEATVLGTDGDVSMDGLMLFSLFVGVIAFSLLYLWLVIHRTRVMAMEDLLDERGLDDALAARRAEATTDVGHAPPPRAPAPRKERSDGGRRIHHRWLRVDVRHRVVHGVEGGALRETTRKTGARRGQVLALSEQNEPSMNDDATDMDLSPRTPVGAARTGAQEAQLDGLLLVLGLVVVAGGVIVTQFLTQAVDYYCNVDEVGQRSGCDEDRRIRLQGTVDEDSVERVANTTVFTISFNGETIPVSYDGEPGGIFKECIPVVVHGVIEDGTLLGDRVEVKHSDEYVAVNDERVADAEAAGCPDAPTT